ncbi:hypothetical protein K1T71_006180 [Dendrolimus kikuchii]|uniref:Uncharacterized protein n=1 Tax=Dendrolimus kikuchii TaxID=765133 RepID=A0ACC1D4N2_9NEOP|nr:hypothetical protein K1T71_006180 [Dendrolimus kikuchii]
MAGVQKATLNYLNVNLNNALIIGIIIAKNAPRTWGSKKKNGETRGVTSFTLRDSDIDTINVEVWGSEYFVITFYERFIVGDVVEVRSPKICVKTGDKEVFRPHVSSPFYLSLNEGNSDVTSYSGDLTTKYLALLHIPTKPSSGYCGLAEILKLPECDNAYVDLLVVVKTVKPVKTIKTKTGTDMALRCVEIMDNTTPASITLNIFDIDTIQRAEEWVPYETVLFIADARVSWRGRPVSVQVSSKTIITHQPHTADAEALRIYIRNQVNTRGGEAAAWAAWSGERPGAASVVQIRDRLASGAPFCASLHALLTHLDLEDLIRDNLIDDELKVRFADHTGELNAKLPISVLEDVLGYSAEQLKQASSDDRSAIGWRILLEQCNAKLAASPPRLIVLALRRASQADPIPLY